MSCLCFFIMYVASYLDTKLVSCPLSLHDCDESRAVASDICLEAEYWCASLSFLPMKYLSILRTNWDNFPNLQKKKSDTYDYVVETILDVMTGRFNAGYRALPFQIKKWNKDIVSSDTSAFGYTYEELQKRLEIVRAGKGGQLSSPCNEEETERSFRRLRVFQLAYR